MKLPPQVPAVARLTRTVARMAETVEQSQVIHHHIACAVGQFSCGAYDDNWCCPDGTSCGSMNGVCNE